MNRFKPLNFLFIILFSVELISCHTAVQNHPAPVVVNRYFYYWQEDTWRLKYNDTAYFRMQKHGANALYLKILDIDWNPVNHAYPVSITRGGYGRYDSPWELTNGTDRVIRDVVPVIFITNKTMLNLTTDELDTLAQKILRKCRVVTYSELQIDCDWTEKSKDMYFAFLKSMKKALNGKKLSATVRLYQYKYRDKTGVPPVDKGMLMVYNVRNVKDYNTYNSIFDEDEAEKYIDGVAKYPIRLDIALPAFSWAVIYRDKQFYCMMRDIKPILKDTCRFLEKKSPGYLVKTDHMYNDTYLRVGDEIKIEAVTNDMMVDAAKLARQCVNSDTVNVSLFEIDEVVNNKVPDETIEAVYNSLR